MLSGLDRVLGEARSRGCAAGAFTCYDLATGAAVVAAAADRRVPAILMVSAEAFRTATGPALVAGLCRLADSAAVSIAVQLDHVDDPVTVNEALAAGANAVMADGAARSYAANVALVQACVRLAVGYGAHVEAELGLIAGDDERSSGAAPAGLTDPGEVAGFLDDTGVACLAVSVGNVHGAYRAPPRLDWDRLGALARVSRVPLSLHGGSGLTAADLRRAVAAGVAKVNVNTTLRAAWLGCAVDDAPRYLEGARLLAYHRRLVDVISVVASETMDALSL